MRANMHSMHRNMQLILRSFVDWKMRKKSKKRKQMDRMSWESIHKYVIFAHVDTRRLGTVCAEITITWTRDISRISQTKYISHCHSACVQNQARSRSTFESRMQNKNNFIYFYGFLAISVQLWSIAIYSFVNVLSPFRFFFHLEIVVFYFSSHFIGSRMSRSCFNVKPNGK